MVILLGYIVNVPRIPEKWMHFNKRQSINHHQIPRRPDPGNMAPHNFQPLGVVGTEETQRLLRPFFVPSILPKQNPRYTLFAPLENQQELEPPKSHGGVDGSDDFFSDFKEFGDL